MIVFLAFIWSWVHSLFATKPVVDPQPLPELADRLSDDPIRNGYRAEQLMKDPLLKQCFENVRQTYLHRFESLGDDDVDGFTQVRLSLTALKAVQAELLKYQFNGQTKRAKER